MSSLVPDPSRKRLSLMLSHIEHWITKGKEKATSRELGQALGTSAETVRKDFSHLGSYERGRAYNLLDLRLALLAVFKNPSPLRAGVAGLDELGEKILQTPGFFGENLEIVAGFDPRQNRIEILEAPVPLFSSYEIPLICLRQKIEIGIITGPDFQAQNMALRFFQGGVQGIINLCDCPVHAPKMSIPVLNLGWQAPIRDFTSQIGHKGGKHG